MSDAPGLHEPRDALSDLTVDRHRAYRSLIEELEAVDWYAQRVDASSDEALKAVLGHNGNEEKEHAAMVLEWLRRHDPVLDAHLRTYLFTSAPITSIERQAEDAGGAEPEESAAAEDAGLGIGSLKERP